jgi:hypothetical protein
MPACFANRVLVVTRTKVDHIDTQISKTSDRFKYTPRSVIFAINKLVVAEPEC